MVIKGAYIITILVVAVLVNFCTEKQVAKHVRFHLMQIDSVPHSAIKEVANVLYDSLNIKVKESRVSGLPDAAWSASRKRYNAEALLKWLRSWQKSETVEFQLLITDKDLGVDYKGEKLRGANGLSVQGGPFGVISDYRLHQLGRNRDSVDYYLGKVALHEAGHMLGLYHCKTPHCIMESVEIKQHITTLGGFCKNCKEIISQM